MKRILIVILLVVAAKVGLERFHVHRNSQALQRVVEELNQKLPQTIDSMRIEQVEYSGRLLRFAVTMLAGGDLTAAMKADATQRLQQLYCTNDALRKTKVGVEYTLRIQGARSINDKVKFQTWSVRVLPEDCR